MPLELRSCTTDDFPRIVEVENAAYADDAFSPILFPGPFPEGIQEFRVQDLAKQSSEDPTTHWMKVIDTDLPESRGIAFAKWNFYHESPAPPRPIRDFGPGSNPEACKKLFGGIADQRAKVLGDKKCVYLHMLSTDPVHTRRGAGSMLMSWGIEQAKEKGVPVYLEASPKGQGLYAKHGFKVIEERRTDLSEWGAAEDHRCWSMIRETDS